MNSTRRPQTFRSGSVSVKLYTVNNRSGGGTYRQFVLAYRNAEGKRETRKFSDLDVAQREAELTAAKLASGEADVLTLSSVERTQYLRAKPLLDSAGVPLLAAIEDYTAARRLLPEGVTLLTAVEAYRHRHSAGDRSLTVADAVAKYVAERRAVGCGEHHLANLETRLNRLVAMFKMPLVDLTIEPVRMFLDNQRNEGRGGIPLAASTRRNYLKTMRAFISYRSAIMKKVAQIAYEAGNSPAIIHSTTSTAARNGRRWPGSPSFRPLLRGNPSGKRASPHRGGPLWNRFIADRTSGQWKRTLRRILM